MRNTKSKALKLNPRDKFMQKVDRNEIPIEVYELRLKIFYYTSGEQ